MKMFKFVLAKEYDEMVVYGSINRPIKNSKMSTKTS